MLGLAILLKLQRNGIFFMHAFIVKCKEGSCENLGSGMISDQKLTVSLVSNLVTDITDIKLCWLQFLFDGTTLHSTCFACCRQCECKMSWIDDYELLLYCNVDICLSDLKNTKKKQYWQLNSLMGKLLTNKTDLHS